MTQYSDLPPEVPPNDQPVPPQYPPGPPIELSYETPGNFGNAPLLVRLGAIFTLVLSGLNIMYVLLQVGVTLFDLARTGSLVPPGVGGLSPGIRWLILAMRILPPLGALVVGGVQVMAGVQLLRRGKHAWVLGLIAAIAGCVEFWTCFCYMLGMAGSVYMIVILCFANVRAYLQMRQA